ncbi:MAG TPA: deoxynucleoside kinase [Flavobacteriales bacterium]|jgi:deoxyguanosine kinase
MRRHISSEEGVIPYRYISIEGNIGAGKTSLTKKMSEEFGTKLVLEEFADNPFLPKFYNQPERYAFPVELSFLSERFSQLKRELNSADLFAPHVLSDYFIGKCQIFAKNNLNKDEYDLFLKMYEIVEGSCPKPDLLVFLYLDTESLLKNIHKRGREYELNISAEYLENIQKQYLEFIRQHQEMRVVIINTSSLDFVNNKNDYEKIKSIILKEHPIGVHRYL